MLSLPAHLSIKKEALNLIEKRKLFVFFTVTFILLGALLFSLFKTLINTILLGLVLSYIMYPIYVRINDRIKMPRISSFAVCMIFVLGISLPILFSLGSLTHEVIDISQRFSDPKLAEEIISFKCETNTTLCNVMNKALSVSILKSSLSDVISEIASSLRTYVGTILLLIPNFLVHVFIILFMMYYLMIDGRDFILRTYQVIPLSEMHKTNIFEKSRNVLKGILFGNILVGAVQAVLAGIGFFIFGINAPILWGIMTFLVSFLPFIGTAIIWLPASVYLIITSVAANDSSGVLRGIGLLVYCTVIVGLIDNILRPKFVSGQTKIHPVLVLFGVIGGISVFNAAGIIIGPLIVGFFITITEMFEQEKEFLFSDECVPICMPKRSRRRRRKAKT